MGFLDRIMKRVLAIRVLTIFFLGREVASTNCKYVDTYRKTTDSPKYTLNVALKRAVV